VVQWEVSGDKKGKLKLKEVRRFDVGTQVEGCVSDDHFQAFYIGEEEVGIWRYGAEPSAGETRVLIDSTGARGNLVSDVEGLALYRIGKKHGYLVASSQGENAFNIYNRENGAYVGKFNISYQGKMVEDCDGIEITSHYLSPNYPVGMIVVQDGNPTNERQSFKMARWDHLAISYFPPLGMSLIDPITSP
jgi:3-phytase